MHVHRIAGLVFLLVLASRGYSAVLSGSFMMREIQDGDVSADLVEVWRLDFDRDAAVPLVVGVASFVTMDGETTVFTWHHTAASVKEIRPSVFRAECNGRLNPFSGLEVVFEVSRGRVSTVSGSMRAGSRGQSVSIFKVDHKTQSSR